MNYKVYFFKEKRPDNTWRNADYSEKIESENIDTATMFVQTRLKELDVYATAEIWEYLGQNSYIGVITNKKINWVFQ